MALLVALGVALVLAFLWAALNPAMRWRFRRFPGPLGLPFLGNLPGILEHDLTAYTATCARKYGGVFKMWFGTTVWVVLADPELIRRVAFKLLSRPYSPASAVHMLTGEQYSLDSKTLVFVKSGADWRNARRSFETSIVHPSSLLSHLPAVHRCIARFLPRLRRHAAAGEPLELSAALADLTLAAVGECAYGVDFRTMAEDGSALPAAPLGSGSGSGPDGENVGAALLAAVRSCFDCLDMNNATVYVPLKYIFPSLTPLWAWMAERFPDAAQRRHMAARAAVASVSRRLMAQWQASKAAATATANGNGNGNGAAANGDAAAATGAAFREVGGGIAGSSFMAAMMEGRRGGREEDRLSDDLVIAQCLTFLLAGFETTAVTITFTIFLLATHPEVEARLLAELDEHLGRPGAEGKGKGEGATGDDGAPPLPYMDAVLKESMRLLPAATALIRDPLHEDLDLGGGRVVPKGTFIFLATQAVQQDPTQWPEPERFLPERFLPEGGGQLGPTHPSAWAPFGMGPRMCVGNKFATMVSKTVLCELYRRFAFRLHPRQRLPLRTRTALTHGPRDGVWVTVTERG